MGELMLQLLPELAGMAVTPAGIAVVRSSSGTWSRRLESQARMVRRPSANTRIS
ncbi:hypothetical protein C8K36_10831 [Rhodococcus sp. OK519]|nr:hypothetical protein C8K36_10831 [Rhodococcus sp. OK519]